MAKKLTRLRIDEVSSVDRGAGEGVKILLMKRDEESEEYWKRNFTTEQRRADAKSGAALPDGSFPIHNAEDLANARRLAGKAKDPAKARAHIEARARALGLSEKKEASMGTNLVKIFSQLFSGGGGNNTITIDKALEGLAESVGTIVNDAANPEELSTGLAKTFEQFGDHLKQTLTAGSAVAKKEGQEMDLAVLKKALGLADTATEADVTDAITKNLAATATLAADVKKVNDELVMAKAEFSPTELAFYKASYDDEEDDLMGDGDPKGKGKPSKKKDFRLASHTEREVTMKVAEPALPAHIQKVMSDNAALAKRVAELEAGGNLVEMAKKATELGLPETEAATLAKVYSGDKEAIEKLMGMTKSALAAAKAGGVFKEFGASGGTGVAETAIGQLNTLADDLRKRDPTLSFPQAFTKVYEDPANSEIVKRERGENRPSAA